MPVPLFPKNTATSSFTPLAAINFGAFYTVERPPLCTLYNWVAGMELKGELAKRALKKGRKKSAPPATYAWILCPGFTGLIRRDDHVQVVEL
ncbi:hypothetical protein AVEN_87112-1 [Araneus ventricosus]|uniref:Uncharacterized protein n=1 Tax=Araneus ventricosus TaxID=182803 RepID=A0A4Y2P8I9_ARAVE|nr:hypothetical protein AVEN_87112-1 [Araneus ventricosus]